MQIERLDVRLDQERHRRLREMAQEHKTPVSELVRRLIDAAYEDTLRARRRRAAMELARTEIEDVPEPADLGGQLEDVHEPGGLY